MDLLEFLGAIDFCSQVDIVFVQILGLGLVRVHLSVYLAFWGWGNRAVTLLV